MKNIRRPGLVHGMHTAAFALLAAIVLTACEPQGGAGRLTVRSLEARITGADSMVVAGGVIDSTWTIPGDDARQLTRSLVLEPGDASEAPNRLVDLALGALVTGFDFFPPPDPPEDTQITQEDSNGLLQITLQQGIVFRASVATDYSRDADLAWQGTGEFQDYTLWIDGTVTPADTLRLSLAGEYEDVHDGEGGRQAILRGQGMLVVATGGEYTVELTERVETMGIPTSRVAGRLADARDEVSPR